PARRAHCDRRDAVGADRRDRHGRHDRIRRLSGHARHQPRHRGVHGRLPPFRRVRRVGRHRVARGARGGGRVPAAARRRGRRHGRPRLHPLSVPEGRHPLRHGPRRHARLERQRDGQRRVSGAREPRSARGARRDALAHLRGDGGRFRGLRRARQPPARRGGARRAPRAHGADRPPRTARLAAADHRPEGIRMTTRADGRQTDQLRPVTIERGWSAQAEGSALISFGGTRVLCTASFTNGVPRWLTGQGKGWVTAEYAMLPRATNERSARESVKGKIGGRTHEISRLIGRALRAVVDTKALGENTIVVDCDVLQADGGTRTAAITGAYVALAHALEWGRDQQLLGRNSAPLIDTVAAVSVGIIDGEPMLDLAYVEDVRAETDMNVVVTGRGLFVEVQGTAEGAPFDKRELDALLDLGVAGCAALKEHQLAALADPSLRLAGARSVQATGSGIRA